MKSFRITQSITDRKDPSLEIYFKDISKLSMITPEEEVELTRRIKKGDKSAINELINANLRFVISVAKQYQGKGLDLVDLIQEGNYGLILSARFFDDTRGYRFISYAVWWIRQSIIKAISEQSRTVRVPTNLIANMSKINKISERFEQLNERELSIDEIEKETKLNKRKIDLSFKSTCKSIPLDNPLKDEDTGCLIDVLSNDNSDPADSSIIESNLSVEIGKVLSKLSYRDQDVIRMSFGIGMQPMSYNEIANRFGVGEERIRQIQHGAIKFIRKEYGDELMELL